MLVALGGWAERWTQVTAEHADPGVVLWSWCKEFLRRDLLPDRRVVVRFDTLSGGRRTTGWMLIDRREAEICRVDPGFGDDLVVTITDPLTFARWHLGLVDWGVAVRSGRVQVQGPPALSRAMPTWNAGPETNARRRQWLERAPAGPSYPAVEGPSGSVASGAGAGAGGGVAAAGSSSTRRP